MINIQQRPLGTFKEHPLTSIESLVQVAGGVGDKRSQPPSILGVLGRDRFSVQRLEFAIECREDPILVFDDRRHLFTQPVNLDQVAHANRMSPPGLVAVAGADATHRGPDRVATPALFEHRLLGHVPRKHHVSPVADQQLPIDSAVLTGDPVEFLKKGSRVDHHAAADHRIDAWAKNARRQQRQLVGLAVELDRVTCVVAALVADNNVVIFGQQVDDLALGFVTPLQADYRSGRHRDTILITRLQSIPISVPGAMSHRVAVCRASPSGQSPTVGSLGRSILILSTPSARPSVLDH